MYNLTGVSNSKASKQVSKRWQIRQTLLDCPKTYETHELYSESIHVHVAGAYKKLLMKKWSHWFLFVINVTNCNDLTAIVILETKNMHNCSRSNYEAYLEYLAYIWNFHIHNVLHQHRYDASIQEPIVKTSLA